MDEKRKFQNLLNVAAEKLGARINSCSDDFFASADNMIKQGRGVFKPNKYTKRGKWMDGWESRRKRDPGHDWCIIHLAGPAQIKGFDVDTNHFLGNHPPFCSIDALYGSLTRSEDHDWIEILPRSPLAPGSQNLFSIEDGRIWTYLRLNIYPDGGVARFKVFGQIKKDWSHLKPGKLINLAAAKHGAKSIACNDMFFSHMDNLIMPGRGKNMSDGWETKRSRTPGNRDWVVIRLAHPGTIKKLVIDTAHFKGNFPDSCTVEGAYGDEEGDISDWTWIPILSSQKLKPHAVHTFTRLKQKVRINHIRLNIFPDGGVSRLRAFGSIN